MPDAAEAWEQLEINLQTQEIDVGACVDNVELPALEKLARILDGTLPKDKTPKEYGELGGDSGFSSSSDGRRNSLSQQG